MKAKKEKISSQIVWFDDKSGTKNVGCNYRQTGHYLLKDGTISDQTVYDMEKGIIINPYMYLLLENMPKKEMSATQAKKICRQHGCSIPGIYELLQLEQVIDKVNSSLVRVGMQEFTLPKSLLSGFWYSEDMQETKGEKKRLLIIQPQQSISFPKGQFKRRKELIVFDNKTVYAWKENTYRYSELKILASDGKNVLLLGPKSSVFLLSDNKMTFCGLEGRHHFDDIIETDTGIYQWYKGMLHPLGIVNFLRMEGNNSHDGIVERLFLEVMDEDGGICITFRSNEWCGEQTDEYTRSSVFYKNENGLYTSNKD